MLARPISLDLRGTRVARVSADLPQIVRIVIAGLLSWQLAEWVLDDGGAHPPVYAVIVPLIAMRDQPYSAFNVSADRMLGVVAGVCVGIGVVNLLGVTLPALGLVLGIGLLAGSVLRLGPAMNLQVALSGLLVFTNSDPAYYGVSRLWETGLGVVVTVIMSALLSPPNARRHFEAELRTAGDDLAGVLRRCAELIVTSRQNEPTPEQVAALREVAGRVEAATRALPDTLKTARLAVTRNPLRWRDREPLEALAGRARLAADLGHSIAILVDESVDLATRTDLRTRWPALSHPLPAILLGVAGIVRNRVRPAQNDADAATDDLAPVVADVRAWQRSDVDRIAAVLRRPVHRLLLLLGGDVLPVVDAEEKAPELRLH